MSLIVLLIIRSTLHSNMHFVAGEEDMNKWREHDNPCTNKWGSCQPEVQECASGWSFETGLCGGPDERQCCAPGSQTFIIRSQSLSVKKVREVS